MAPCSAFTAQPARASQQRPPVATAGRRCRRNARTPLLLPQHPAAAGLAGGILQSVLLWLRLSFVVRPFQKCRVLFSLHCLCCDAKKMCPKERWLYAWCMMNSWCGVFQLMNKKTGRFVICSFRFSFMFMHGFRVSIRVCVFPLCSLVI